MINRLDTNNPSCLGAFIHLNELWISEHFALEQADRDLAANPGQVMDAGGFVFSLVQGGEVLGVCALFKESDVRFQLARMAVRPDRRGQGLGRALIAHAIAHARTMGAQSLFLLSNTKLAPAIALYESVGFVLISRGQHPVYSRCDVVMELAL
jgi:putative acetyltransferase